MSQLNLLYINNYRGGGRFFCGRPCGFSAANTWKVQPSLFGYCFATTFDDSSGDGSQPGSPGPSTGCLDAHLWTKKVKNQSISVGLGSRLFSTLTLRRRRLAQLPRNNLFVHLFRRSRRTDVTRARRRPRAPPAPRRSPFHGRGPRRFSCAEPRRASASRCDTLSSTLQSRLSTTL